MYNKKPTISAILALITSALFVGLLLMFRLSGLDFGEDNLGAALFLVIIGGYGTIIFFAGSVLAAVVTFFCGVAMLLAKTKKGLISANTALFVLGIIFFLPVALGIVYLGLLYSMTVGGTLRIVFAALAGIAYIGCIVVGIGTRIKLKRLPEASPTPAPVQSYEEDSTEEEWE